jgi:hypothetical protein
MKTRKISAITATIVLMFLLGAVPLFPAKAAGARSDELIIRFYSDVESAYAALAGEDIDLIGYEITADLFVTGASQDTNIACGPVGDRGMYEFDILNNWTCPLFPGIRNPMTYLEMRQALAMLTPKDQIVAEFCGGFADRIDQPISYAHAGWRNQSYWYEDGTYPYEYSPADAAAKLDAGGFLQSDTDNPYYDAAFPGSALKLREYPSGHEKEGQVLDDIEVCARTDDVRRDEAGIALADNMRKHGLPVNLVRAPASTLYPKVMDNFEYHVYTGGWSLGRFPAISIFGLYHSDYYFPGGSNYVTGYQSDNATTTFPLLDELLYAGRYPADYDEAVAASKEALGYGWGEMCLGIPLFSARSFWAWRADLKGVVNAEGTGPENGYTFINAYKTDGSPLVYGLKTAPLTMNSVYSSWYYDYQCLDRMNIAGGLDVAPYDSALDQAGYILDWEVANWTDPDDGVVKSNITQWYRDDAWFVKPVSGLQGEHINATHMIACMWYYKATGPDAWIYDNVVDLKRVIQLSDHDIQILYNTSSYWNTYLGGTYIFSFDLLTNSTVDISHQVLETLTSNADGYMNTTEGVFHVNSVTAPGPVVLTKGTDYDIFMGEGDKETDIRIINVAYQEIALDLDYLAVGDARGTPLGGLEWQSAFEGAGMFYATYWEGGVAGTSMGLAKNPWYPLEDPPLGEIDWVKKTTGPFAGAYRIDIYDVVFATSAYGSKGETIPDSNWFAGADLAPGGQAEIMVNIYDVVTITYQYGNDFDNP